MSVLSEIEIELEGLEIKAWQRELALSLASGMDKQPNASMSAQLRSLMDELGASPLEQTGDAADDLAAKRAARRATQGAVGT